MASHCPGEHMEEIKSLKNNVISIVSVFKAFIVLISGLKRTRCGHKLRITSELELIKEAFLFFFFSFQK